MMLFLPFSGKNRIRGAFALKLQKSQDERSFWPDVGGENLKGSMTIPRLVGMYTFLPFTEMTHVFQERASKLPWKSAPQQAVLK